MVIMNQSTLRKI